jgi:hypothetical protein
MGQHSTFSVMLWDTDMGTTGGAQGHCGEEWTGLERYARDAEIVICPQGHRIAHGVSGEHRHFLEWDSRLQTSKCDDRPRGRNSHITLE